MSQAQGTEILMQASAGINCALAASSLVLMTSELIFYTLTVACPRWVEGGALPVQGVAATSLQGAGPDLVLLLGR